MKQNHELDKTLDATVLLETCKPALEHGQPVRAEIPIRNIHRSVGTRLGAR